MQQLTFKEFEHEAWLNAVPQYDASFSRLTRQTIPAILSVLDLRENMRLLDVACGPGYLAAAAHRQGVHAAGVDFSSAMIARARENHPGIHFAEGDAEDLQHVSDAAFDAVAMNFGIIHLAHPELALKAAHRVLKPSGKMAFTAWCKPQEAVGFSFVLHGTGWYARILQHEIDHLGGTLFIDRVLLPTLVTDDNYTKLWKEMSVRDIKASLLCNSDL